MIAIDLAIDRPVPDNPFGRYLGTEGSDIYQDFGGEHAQTKVRAMLVSEGSGEKIIAKEIQIDTARQDTMHRFSVLCSCNMVE